MIKLESIEPSVHAAQKLTAKFTYEDDGKIKKRAISFGARGYGDYTIYSKEDKAKAEIKKASYLARHEGREDWSNPMSAGALSRWVLWNKPTLKASIADFRKRFGL